MKDSQEINEQHQRQHGFFSLTLKYMLMFFVQELANAYAKKESWKSSESVMLVLTCFLRCSLLS